MSISSFITEISPSSDEISQVSTSWNKIRETLKSKLPFIYSSILTWSYIRGTKISPIDDLDIFLKINASNTWIEWKDNNECKIYIYDWYYNTHSLKNYTVFENWKYYISPNKILNEMKKKIEETYTTTSEIKRNWECVTTYLSSYDLTIDTVPYIWVSWQEFLLIPTSWNNLYWKKTNPKIDKEKIDELNNVNHFFTKIKWVIKIMKYWNLNINTWVKFRSYVLECLVYEALKDNKNYNLSYIDLLKIVIAHIYENKYFLVMDIPWYDYLNYSLTDQQFERIKTLLSTLWDKLNESEDAFITYIKS